MEEQEKRETAKSDSLEDLQKKLHECEAQRIDYLAGWQRARADFINYKKEEMERIEELMGYAKEEFFLQILSFLDNFDIAERKLPESLKKEEYVTGILQIGAQMRDFLKNQGIQEIKTVGEKFDPNFHEVVEGQEKEGFEPGIIIEEVQKGYLIQGRLLRPAKVKVTK